jgi:hypothetical protein
MLGHGPTPLGRRPWTPGRRRGRGAAAGWSGDPLSRQRPLGLPLARHRQGDSLADKPRSGRPPKLGPDGDAVLRAHVEAHPDATLPEHAARLEAATGVRLSPSHLSRVLARLEVPLKKRPWSPPSATS